MWDKLIHFLGRLEPSHFLYFMVGALILGYLLLGGRNSAKKYRS